MYTEYKPSALLQPYVECFWINFTGTEEPLCAHTVYPDGCMDIIFNFGPALQGKNASGTFENFYPCFIIGTMTAPVEVSPAPINLILFMASSEATLKFANIHTTKEETHERIHEATPILLRN